MADFLLDTNVLLYRSGIAPHYDVSDFWDKELSKQDNDVFIPKEVIYELEAQYYQLEAQGKSDIVFKIKHQMIPSMETLSIPNSLEIEQIVKKASSYLCANYHIIKPATSKQLNPTRWWNEYPAVSDARILLSALYFECTLATFNIKDFMLLLVLGETVYNPIDNCPYPPIDPNVLSQIYQDPVFLDYKRKIDSFSSAY
ncbi:PIN domain-containing protein [Priestia megaterium]|uniref:PIN domain-containing protein n=1 Tax=Priestia megaterium TaxID=1404 RepID=UPI003F7FC64F